jgi:hypothetical protein
MVHASSRVCIVLLALLLGGCGGGGDAGGRGGGGGTTGTGGGGDAGGRGGRGGGGGTTGTGGMGGTGPCTPASCSFNGSNRYCATCGLAAGQCVSRPLDCILQPGPVVCGCDGKLYMSSCEAEAFGSGVGPGGAPCETPPGTFRCGTWFCTQGTQYCETWILTDQRDYDGKPYVLRYACADLAAECGATPTCDCVTRSDCSDCTASAGGELTVTCPVVAAPSL